ncbi:MAG: type II toxin-antitoxin system HicA family toxin [Planctomycetota bacterium]
MPKFPVFKSQDVLRKLKRLGLEEVRQKGSHVMMRDDAGHNVTVPVHQGKDMKTGTLRGILRDAEIDIQDFIDA